MRNIFLKFLLCLFVLAQAACNKSRLPDSWEDCLIEESMGLYVIDSITGKNLIGKNGERYHPDSVRIFSKGIGPQINGRIFTDTAGNYRGGITYLFEMGSASECNIAQWKFSGSVFVYFNQNDTDTFFIDKQRGLGFAYFLNGKHLLTTSPQERGSPVFYLEK